MSFSVHPGAGVCNAWLREEQANRYGLHGPLSPLAIPATVPAALKVRWDHLAATKVVAQLGAAIGRICAYDLLEAVTPLDSATLQGALSQLVKAEVVAQRSMPSQAVYTFKHVRQILGAAGCHQPHTPVATAGQTR